MSTDTVDSTPDSTWVVIYNSSEPWDDYVHSHPAGSFKSAQEAEDYIEKQVAADRAAMEELGDNASFIQTNVWYNIDEVPFLKDRGELKTVYTIITSRQEDTGNREITDVSFNHVPVAEMVEDKLCRFLLSNPDEAYAETPEGYISSEIFPPMVLNEEGTWYEDYEEVFYMLSPKALVLKAPEGYTVPVLNETEPKKRMTQKISDSGLDAMLGL